MTSAELNQAIYDKRIELCALVAKQVKEYDEKREEQIVKANMEIHELKAQLHRAVQAEQQRQPA